MKKLIAYDLDGTLADTRQDIIHGVLHMLQAMGAPPLEAAEIERCVGRGLHDLIRGTLRMDDSKRIEKGARCFRDYYGAHMLDHTRLFKGAREVLEYFHPRPQAVLTNKPNPFSERMLEGLNVRSFFMAVLTGEPGRPQKPDPYAFCELLKQESISPEEALFVGDSPVDIETGRRAGVETVVMMHGFSSEIELKSHTPDHLVRDFTELLALARSRGW